MNVVEEYTCVNKDSEIEFRYEYRLISNNYKGMQAYGIEIERKDYIGVKNVNLEREKVDLVSVNRHKVKKLIVDLYNNQVSPIHLIDIIGGYVDENVYEFDNDLYEEAIN